MSKYKYNDEQFINAVANNKSIAGVLKSLGLRPYGGNYQIAHKNIKRLNLDTSHFTGQGWSKGMKFSPKRQLSEILTNGVQYQSYKLAQRLVSEHVKEYRCEVCGNDVWLDNPIPLELHHINGDHCDNRLENLQLLCPNCHALTNNYRGKNKGMGAYKETYRVEVG